MIAYQHLSPFLFYLVALAVANGCVRLGCGNETYAWDGREGESPCSEVLS